MIEINIEDGKYNPSNINIEPDEKVKWTNNTNQDHTVSSTDQITFNSGILKPGETYEYMFKEKGIYGYECELHLGEVQGEVEVAPKPAAY